MRKRKLIFKRLRSPVCLWLMCMAAGGGVSVAISNTWDRPFYVEIPVRGGTGEEKNSFLLQAAGIYGALEEEAWESALQDMPAAALDMEGDSAAKEEKAPVKEEDHEKRLNFAFYYDDGADTEDASQSYAGKVYAALLRQDASWMSGIYGLRHVSPETMAARLGMDKSSVTGIRHLNGLPLDGEENAQVIPSWNRFNVTFRNGDGAVITGHSNIKEIMSLASVYAYFNQEKSYDTFSSYADKLWHGSHSYKISVSDVYYCPGECQYYDDSQEEDGSFQTGDSQGQEYGASAQADSMTSDSGSREQDQQTEAGRAEGVEQTVGNTQEAGQTSHEPIPASQTSGETSGEESSQVSHEPIPASQTSGETSGEGSSQISHEPIPASQTSGETSGEGSSQVSHEPIPASQTSGETSGEESSQASHEPIPASQSSGDESDWETKQAVQETAASAEAAKETLQASDQVSHEPIPAVQSPEKQSQDEMIQEPVEDLPSSSAENPLPEANLTAVETTGESLPESGPISHEPIPASQASDEGTDHENQESGPTVETAEGKDLKAAQVSDESGKETGSTSRQESDKRHYCQGHIDLNISAVIIGIDENKSLFTIGDSFETPDNSNGWGGWDDMSRDCVRTITGQDWYGEYGLTGQDTMFVHNPLSGTEITRYMNMLPDHTSEKRRKVVREALLSIGCIPYYWGGKPAGGGFERNAFGTVVSPDEDGRILKGLDCSGWINWVYWTALGTSLPAESTSGLMSCGKAVEKRDLQAGDILIRAGKQPHVYLFLAWAPDGSMYLIHETTGNVNNVTIGTYDLDLPYYRCLINEE